MGTVLVTIGSITSSVRLSKLLRSQMNINASVVHTPAQLNKGGCSYSIRTSNQAVDAIKQIAKRYGISVRRIYEEKNIDGESVYNDIS